MPNNSPSTNIILDDNERAIEEALANGSFEEKPDFAATKAMLEDAAKHYRQLNTTKPVTLRINQLDLIRIKAKAKRQNTPYQTLLSSVLHDFAEDRN